MKDIDESRTRLRGIFNITVTPFTSDGEIDTKGVARDLFPDGGLKAKGRMKDGELHGAWSWWRKDGTLMRTGSFDRGRQVGTWTTYDATGAEVSSKQL